MKLLICGISLVMLLGCTGNPYKCGPTFKHHSIYETQEASKDRCYFIGIKCNILPTKEEPKWPKSDQPEVLPVP